MTKTPNKTLARMTAAERKLAPLARGLVDYFPDALIEVAALSAVGSTQHHPDEPMHWDKNKSTDDDDALLRHFVDRGTRDVDNVRHRTKVAWRALAGLQREIEAEQAAQATNPRHKEQPRLK